MNLKEFAAQWKGTDTKVSLSPAHTAEVRKLTADLGGPPPEEWMEDLGGGASRVNTTHLSVLVGALERREAEEARKPKEEAAKVPEADLTQVPERTVKVEGPEDGLPPERGNLNLDRENIAAGRTAPLPPATDDVSNVPYAEDEDEETETAPADLGIELPELDLKSKRK